MKGKKKLRHAQLTDEVITQVKARFPPKIIDIKKCIDTLIEKEYLERGGAANDELSYVA